MSTHIERSAALMLTENEVKTGKTMSSDKIIVLKAIKSKQQISRVEAG